MLSDGIGSVAGGSVGTSGSVGGAGVGLGSVGRTLEELFGLLEELGLLDEFGLLDELLVGFSLISSTFLSTAPLSLSASMKMYPFSMS